MSKKAATVGDIGTDHDGFPPTPIIEGSQDIIIDNKPAARVGDALAPHSKENHLPHDRAITTGSKTVFFNYKAAALTGSEVGCGGVIIGGSSVIIGDQAPSGGASSIAMRSAEITPVADQLASEPVAATSSVSPVETPAEGAYSSIAMRSAEITPVADQLASEPVAATSSVSTVEIPAEGAYWPPYDFAQGKSLEVIYTAEPVNFALLSLEEAHEFLSNLYKEIGGKDQISDRKSQFDFASGIKSAYETARGLGGLGVTSYTKNINGKEWVIIKNYRRHKQTLMKGNKWLASNPKIVEAGIGINNIKGSMRYVKMNTTVEIAFSVGINAVDYILRDEATLLEFGVNSASDIVKGMITLVAAGAVAAAFASGGILISGVVFAASSYFIGDQVSKLDKKLGISDKFKRKVEEVLQ